MATSPYVIEYEGTFHLDLAPDEAWTIIWHVPTPGRHVGENIPVVGVDLDVPGS
jgi:hypothetical protein